VAVEFQPGPPQGTVYSLIVQFASTSGTVTGGGIDCTNNMGTCKVDMTGPVTLRATPTSGYSVKGWYGCTPSEDLSTCAVTPDASKVVAIEFLQGPPPPRPKVLNVHMLTFSGTVTGGGIDCTNNGGICQVTMQGEVTLTAAPSSGFSVRAWTGCTPSPDLRTCTVPGTVDQAVAIEFASGPPAGSQFTLGVRMISGSGTVTGGGLDCTDGGGVCSVSMSGPVTLRASPSSGYAVKSWSGCTPSADRTTCSVAGSADAAVSIAFEALSTSRTLSVQVLGAAGGVAGGGIDCGGSGAICSVTMTGPLTLVASPAAGNTVQGWTGCTPSADLATCTVSGTSDAAVTVTFQVGAAVDHALSVNFETGGGTVTGGGIDCREGAGTCAVRITGPVTLTAHPFGGVAVERWTGCAPSADMQSCYVDGTRDASVSIGFVGLEE
jgi:hypothetical protein